MTLREFYMDYQVFKNGRKVGLKNRKTGFELIPAQFSSIHTACPRYADQIGFFKVKEDEKYFLCNLYGKRITEKMDYIGDYNCGIVNFAQGSRWGFMDDSGSCIITPKYNSTERIDVGKFKVKMNGRWGVVDVRGEVVKPEYENIVVHANRLYGLKNGELIRLLV